MVREDHLEGGHAVSRVLAEGEHEERGAPVTRSDLDRTWLRAQHHLHDVPGAALGGVVQRRKPLVEASSKSTSRRKGFTASSSCYLTYLVEAVVAAQVRPVLEKQRHLVRARVTVRLRGEG